jgi:hypothetical protein
MTSVRALRLLVRLALGTGLFLFTSASSCDAGDRALGGGCPAGEVCDPSTEGLHFEGATFAEGLFEVGDVKRLAVGGRQDVRLFETDADGHHVAFADAYVAGFDAGAIDIEATTGNVVTLRGLATGSGKLRITNPSTGELFDRLTVSASEVDTAELAPSLVILLDGGSDTARLYTPGAIGFIHLRSVDELSLVDEDAAITGTGIAQSRWDTFTVGKVAPGPHTLTITAGDHAPIAVDYEVVHADVLVHKLGDEVTRTGRGTVCFGARNAGRPVHASWTFEIDGGTLDGSPFVGCTNVLPGDGTELTVRAFADGLSTSVTLPIVETSTKRGLAAPRIARTAGDRFAR